MYEGEMLAKDRAYANEMAVRKMSFREQIENDLKRFQEQVEKHKKLLALLDANPAIAEFMELTRS